MATCRPALNQNWHALRFGDVEIVSDAQQHVFEVQVFLADLEPNSVRIELYADSGDAGASVRQEMRRLRQLSGTTDGYVYSAAVPAVRPATDFTARLIPHHDGVAIPLEDARILWQR